MARWKRSLFIFMAVAMLLGVVGSAGSVQAERGAQPAGTYPRVGRWTTNTLRILNGGGIQQGSVRCTLTWEGTQDLSTVFDSITCSMTDSRRDGKGIWLSVDRRKTSSDSWEPFMTRTTCKNVSGSGTTTKCSNWDYALANSYQLRIRFGLRDEGVVISTITRTFSGVPGNR